MQLNIVLSTVEVDSVIVMKEYLTLLMDVMVCKLKEKAL